MLRKLIPKYENVIRFSRKIWTVSVSDSNVCLRDSSTDEIKFPFVWLRDNCRCSKCFHESSESRTIHINKFNFNAIPNKTTISEKNLEIEWNDHHQSTFKIPWLIERQFANKEQSLWKNKVYKDEKLLWRAKEFPSILKRFSFNKLMESDTDLLSLLECLSIWGIAIVDNAGEVNGKVQQLAERIAFLKKTQYGDLFRVEAKQSATNVAYLNGPLQLHTDLPYYQYKPGLNVLHCIIQGDKGGDNQIADCFAIANDLKELHPSWYKILSSTNVVWSDKCYEDGRLYHSVYESPVICEDSSGKLERINFSQPQRDSHFNIPLGEVKEWYSALKVFSEMMYSPKYSVFFKMKPGEILAFDNLRLVHGRSDYSGDRFVEGVYVDWDHVYSRIRVLRSTLH